MHQQNQTNWQQKLMVFLHDPPEKAYDFSPAHEKSAEARMGAFGLDPAAWMKLKCSDWSSSAADRFPFPSADKVREKTVSFKHPLSGQELFASADFPTQEQAASFIKDVIPSFLDKTDEPSRYWLAWRLWMEFAASHRKGQGHKAETIPYLPADTRIPDHTIWQHCSVASALEATRGDDGKLKPAFLLFQLGPVQEFIEQARSTRDLWSGSYLISWLMAHAMQYVAENLGPDNIISPSLRGQPRFDWLNQEKLKQAKYDESASYWDHLQQYAFQELVLTPVLPNRFLAVVPADFDAGQVVQSLEKEWLNISNVCKSWLAEKGCPIPHEDRWAYQVRHCWQATWQVWPWQTIDETIRLFKQTPIGKTSQIDLAYEIAKKARDDGGYAPNEGWAWSAHYQLCRHRLDACRQTRDFDAWQGADNAAKDDYSGKEEEVIDEKWRETARGKDFGFLFRKEDEHLGAVNLIKRVWHKAYLEKERKLTRASESFDSVPAVAAEPWKIGVLGQMHQNSDAWPALLDFQDKVTGCAEKLDFQLPQTDGEGHWLERVDASVCYESYWNTLKEPAILHSLKDLIKKARVGKPSSYYAVLALDGDNMGEWVSGARTPPIEKVLCPKALKYFRDLEQGKEWLGTHRPVSPSYHLQFSEALSNFGLYCARRIVEYRHGRLIYSGGDDVLAMLPAEEAIPCAQGLRMAFRGGPELAVKYPDLFRETKPGMIRLKDGDWKKGARRPHEPSWPLLAPGPKATASVGLAIGHIREPLQDMVDAARRAEKRAKKYPNKDALAVSLFKRSGEQIEWGAKFIPEPFELLAFLDEHYRAPYNDPKKAMPISGKFPYRICELLRKYEPTESMDNWREVAQRELDWAINQLKKHEILGDLRSKGHAWLNASPTLADFYNLFAVEAFIARQGEE